MKAVLDTNVVISGIFFGGVLRKVLEAWTEGRFELILTPSIFDEYLATCGRLGVTHPGLEFQEILTTIVGHGTLVPETVSWGGHHRGSGRRQVHDLRPGKRRRRSLRGHAPSRRHWLARSGRADATVLHGSASRRRLLGHTTSRDSAARPACMTGDTRSIRARSRYDRFVGLHSTNLPNGKACLNCYLTDLRFYCAANLVTERRRREPLGYPRL